MSLQISLSPNVERDDIWQAIRTLCSPWTWRDETQVVQAQETLSNYLGQPTVLVSSGRAAIAAVLRAYGIGKGDEVIVQAFTCVSVPAAVTWIGATPVFADIAEHTYNLDATSVLAQITERTKAIIVQHTFGLPADWQALHTVARARGILLIEDCAHALGATYQGQVVGTLGDAAIFSFGRDKMLSCVFGGAVTSKDPRILAFIRQEQAALALPPAWWVAQQLCHPILMSIIKPLYFMAGIGKVLLVIAQRLGIISRALQVAERALQPPVHIHWRFSPALATLLARQLPKLARFTLARRKVAAQYQRAGVSIPQVTPASEPAWLRYPVTVTEPRQTLQQAKQMQLLLGDWYLQPVFPIDSTTTVYSLGTCPVAEAAAATTINLPTMPTLKSSQSLEVIAFLKQAELI